MERRNVKNKKCGKNRTNLKSYCLAITILSHAQPELGNCIGMKCLNWLGKNHPSGGMNRPSKKRSLVSVCDISQLNSEVTAKTGQSLYDR